MRSRETARVSVAACIAVTFALGAVPARAQATDKFADAVINSVESVSGLGTSAYFALVLNSQLTTFPVATSSGAFTYTFDPATRTFARRVRTFGPWFVERAATLGRSRSVAFGASVEPVRFESLDGRRLSDAPFYARFRFLDGRQFTRSLSTRLSSMTVAAFGTYAVTPAVDVTVVVPVSRVTYGATLALENGHRIDTATVTSTGLGDVEARAKWSVWRMRDVEASAEYTMRLPTGVEGVHGTGRAQQKLGALISARVGPVQPHVNVGYSFRVAGQSPGESTGNLLGFLGPGATSNEASYAVGAEWAPQRRVTVSADVVGRLLKDNIRFAEVTRDRTEPNPYVPEEPYGFFVDSIEPTPADVRLVIGSAGAKYQLVGNTLVAWHVIFPLSAGGLRPGVSSVFGLEYGF